MSQNTDDQPQKPSHDMHGACSECVPQKPECTCGSLRTKGYCAVHSSPGEIARKLGQAIEASFDKPDATPLEWVIFKRHDSFGWALAPLDGFVFRNDEPKPESIVLVEKSAYDLCRKASTIKEEQAFKFKAERDALKARVAELEANWKELELEQVQHIDILSDMYEVKLADVNQEYSKLVDRATADRAQLNQALVRIKALEAQRAQGKQLMDADSRRIKELEVAYDCLEKVYQMNRDWIEDAKEREQKLVAALEFYADKRKWHQFISGGNIGSTQDGDFAMAFDDGEDSPWVIAAAVLAEHKGGG